MRLPGKKYTFLSSQNRHEFFVFSANEALIQISQSANLPRFFFQLAQILPEERVFCRAAPLGTPVYCLQSHHRPVNDLSTVVQLTNRLLCFWADGGFVCYKYKRVSSPSFLISCRSLYNNIMVCNRTG